MQKQKTETVRKRPKQARSQTTVLTIFEATAQILDQEGEKSLTTNRVAERAGFSIGTLYQYFPNMDAILLAMIDKERQRLIAHLEQFIVEAESSDADPTLLIRLFVRALIDGFGVAPTIFRPLLKRGWQLDHTPEVMASAQALAARIQLAIVRRNHPAFPPPDDAAMFVATRGALGVIRAAVHEDSVLIGTPDFEDALVRLAIGQLRTA
ncbi:transcriptional regulator, TetR family [Rhodoblastus acidophilus]|uniref:Transcriptional regulator, TetR family n=1 Tax=Rhodoblastus acidophilus TaxID=1074 RepID=A0A212SCR0_RHOAC|nr:TetR/AcrR family transcriptional regulator [Rhodoblastus acidophilus]PPQ35587.1 TetR/AcrR family transcriptional regulator [Rhodoblastus acidophilus]RAI16988.1 TetR/AcrR family transcriptional regulator [Rhodoblastus acidophilus]SNB83344.1 transcriptional regulator, TetR family [Rhodoblastus acidophilus]